MGKGRSAIVLFVMILGAMLQVSTSCFSVALTLAVGLMNEDAVKSKPPYHKTCPYALVASSG